MKILIVAHYFPPHFGGIENVALSQAESLAALGHDVTVITSDIPAGGQTPPTKSRVIRVPALAAIEHRFDVPYPIFGPRLFQVLREEIAKADVVHAHGHVFMPSVVAAVMARRRGKAFIVTQHNTFVDYSSALLRGVQRLADQSVGKYTLRHAAEVLCVSPATQQYVETLTNAGCASSTIHYNGVDVERFHPAADRESLRRQLSLPTDKVIFLCVRRITFKNGIDTLLQAAERLERNPDIMFVVCGAGPGLDTVRSFVESRDLANVRIVGRVAEEDLPAYYAAADVFVLPSKTGEGFPLVILEAMASGLPVIATRSGGHSQFITESGCGYLVEPDQPVQIAEKALTLGDSPDLREQLSRRNREFTLTSLSWDANARDLLSAFERARG
jgi:glycosyltransferase involved in cell wall biosynthesis